MCDTYYKIGKHMCETGAIIVRIVGSAQESGGSVFWQKSHRLCRKCARKLFYYTLVAFALSWHLDQHFLFLLQ
jgi:hypothetical protein